MELHLKIIGYLFIVLAILHLFFSKYFKWKQELKPLSLINRQIMEVHTFFIALVVFGNGILNVFYANELVNNPFGKVISFGLFVFWTIRLIFQLFIYSPKLWKGKTFETSMHILFTFFWIYCSTIYYLAWK